jgi:hypothetical protein
LQQSHLAYRETAARVPANTAVEIVGADDKVKLSVEALDKVDEPASLTALRAAVDARLPSSTSICLADTPSPCRKPSPEEN